MPNTSGRIVMRILFLVAVVLNSVFVATASEKRPNIILMMSDDQGWGDTGYNGHPVLQTPNLDAMAENGLRFNRFYSAAPVCSPTRGSCLTGRHPYRYGIFYANIGHLTAEEITLAEILQKKGYTTGHFGKWHLGTLTKTEKDSNRGGPDHASHYSPPWKNGFDFCFSSEARMPTWDPLLKPKGFNPRLLWWNRVTDITKTEPFGASYWTNGKKVEAKLRGDDSQIIIDRVLPFIREAVEHEKPFFTVIWFHTPHQPVVAGPPHIDWYSNLDEQRQNHFGCITAMDEQIGRLRTELSKLNVRENTMLWFCSDNGPAGVSGQGVGSTKGLRGRKGDLFEGGVRVPGILEWPARIKSPRITEVPASTSDYFPTVLDVLDTKMPDKRPIDGISLLPLIQGQMTERPRPIYFESRDQTSLIENRFKIIRFPLRKNKRDSAAASTIDDKESPYMLFDLIADPSEKNNLAARYPEIVRRMTGKLKTWRKSCLESWEGKDFHGRNN